MGELVERRRGTLKSAIDVEKKETFTTAQIKKNILRNIHNVNSNVICTSKFREPKMTLYFKYMKLFDRKRKDHKENKKRKRESFFVSKRKKIKINLLWN